jgi:hypothetical protein
MFHIIGAQDYKNRALIQMSTHKNAGEKYFGFTVPEPSSANPRLQGRIYNFFQYLGPKKTRHIAFWNTDP